MREVVGWYDTGVTWHFARFSFPPIVWRRLENNWANVVIFVSSVVTVDSGMSLISANGVWKTDTQVSSTKASNVRLWLR